MLRKTISICFLLSAIFMLFLAVRGLTSLNPPEESIDTLKSQAMEFIRQNKVVDANSVIKKILTNYALDAKLSSVVYDIAEAYRNSSKFEKSMELYRYIIVNLPTSGQAALSQSGLAISSVATGNLESARIELEKLKTNYASEPNIAQMVFNVGDAFYWFKRYSDANNVYKYVIDTYPNSENAMWATMGLAISCIANKNTAAAEIYINKLTKDYPNESRLQEALFYVAGRFGFSKNYDNANQIYKKIISRWAKDTWAKNAALESAKLNVIQYIDKNDEPNTLKAVDNLINDFNGPDLPAVIFDVAARTDNINQYGFNKLTVKLYDIVKSRNPASPQAAAAKIAVDRINIIPILDANDVNVPQIVDKFIDEHKDSAGLFGEVSRLVEHYYIVSGKLRYRSSFKENCARNRIALCEKIIERFPDSFDKARAYKIAADDYQGHRQNLKALEYYQKILDTYPDYAETGQILFSMAQSYNYMWRTGQVERDEVIPLVIDAYQRIVQDYPGSPPIRAARGNLRRLQEQE